MLLGFYLQALRRASRSRWSLFGFVLATGMHALAQSALALATAACARSLMRGDAVFPHQKSPLDQALSRGALFFACVGLAAILIKSAGAVYAAYVQAQWAGWMGTGLRRRMLGSNSPISRLQPPRHFDHGQPVHHLGPPLTHGEGIASLTIHIRELEEGLNRGLLGGVRALSQLLPLMVALCVVAPTLAGVAVFVFVPFSLWLSRVRRGWKRAHANAARESVALLEASEEAVRYADLWISYGAADKLQRSIGTIGDALVQSRAKLEADTAAMSGANEFLAAVALVGAIALERTGWLGAELDGSKVLVFLAIFFLMYRPLREFTEARLAFRRAQLCFERFLPFVAEGHGSNATPPPASAATVAGPYTDEPFLTAAPTWPLARLDIQGFQMTGRPPLSFSIEPGAMVALVGPTGSGKTTLLRWMLGLETQATGELSFDGCSIAQRPPGPRDRPFAWVPQDSPLLADTLTANIALGRPSESAFDISEILALLGASSLSASLGDARLGVGGRLVSGGERQWIALARAIATGQPILLLDEPTSGLDLTAQAAVLDALSRLKGKRSILLVTHRPEPLALADVVITIAARL